MLKVDVDLLKAKFHVGPPWLVMKFWLICVLSSSDLVSADSSRVQAADHTERALVCKSNTSAQRKLEMI